MRLLFPLAISLVASALACGRGDIGSMNAVAEPDASAPPPFSSDAGPPPPPTCGETQDVDATMVDQPPDLLIVLDRSGSMLGAVDATPGSPSKWDTMVAAIDTLSVAHEAQIHFGLSVFPTDDYCGVSPGAELDPGPLQASAMSASLAGLSPGGNTPAHLALQEAKATYQALPLNEHGRYVLFATDGMPNCSPTDPSSLVTAAVTDLSSAGIPTFVLGFGAGALVNPTLLDELALAGTMPKAGGPPFYYYADDPAELATELESIIEQVAQASCEFALADAPGDPDDLLVFADGAPVPRDPSHTDGWDIDGDVVTLYGPACDAIQGQQVAEMSFAFGCPVPPVP